MPPDASLGPPLKKMKRPTSCSRRESALGKAKGKESGIKEEEKKRRQSSSFSLFLPFISYRNAKGKRLIENKTFLISRNPFLPSSLSLSFLNYTPSILFDVNLGLYSVSAPEKQIRNICVRKSHILCAIFRNNSKQSHKF